MKSFNFKGKKYKKQKICKLLKKIKKKLKKGSWRKLFCDKKSLAKASFFFQSSEETEPVYQFTITNIKLDRGEKLKSFLGASNPTKVGMLRPIWNDGSYLPNKLKEQDLNILNNPNQILKSIYSIGFY